jgi:hypothetical protein
MKIFFDIDGVLADFTGNLALVANELWPGKIPPKYSPSDWDYSGVLTKPEWNQVWDKIKTIPNFWYRSEPIRDNVEKLSKWLRQTNHEIFFITSRMDTGGTGAKAQTLLWLHNHKLCPDGAAETYPRIIVVSHAYEKAEYIEKHRIDFGIDDYPPTVSALNNISGHKCYLLDATWNQDSSEPRVESVQEFLDLVDSFPHQN